MVIKSPLYLIKKKLFMWSTASCACRSSASNKKKKKKKKIETARLIRIFGDDFGAMPGKFMGIVGRDRSDSKSNR